MNKPKTIIYIDSRDDLSAARGAINGIILGCMAWGGIAVAIWLIGG